VIAERFAAEGARCVLVGRDEERLNGVKSRLVKFEGSEHDVRIGDVGDREFWRGLRKEVRVTVLNIGASRWEKS
jgi:short-subunit dehydrogenase